MFDPNKPVQTKCGLKARILTTELNGYEGEAIGAIVYLESGITVIRSYQLNGKYCQWDDSSLDLVNIIEKKYVGVYEYTGISYGTHATGVDKYIDNRQGLHITAVYSTREEIEDIFEGVYSTRLIGILEYEV